MKLRDISEITDPAASCSRDCWEASVACTEAFRHSLGKGGEHREPAHLQLLLDAAEVCRTTAHLLAKGSFYAADLCVVCADLCEACALDCEQFEEDDTLRECARLCRACMISCRRISADLAA